MSARRALFATSTRSISRLALSVFQIGVETITAHPFGADEGALLNTSDANVTQARRLVGAVGANLGAVFYRAAERLFLVDELAREVPRDLALLLFLRLLGSSGRSGIVALPVNVTGTNSRNYSFNIQPEAVNFQLTVVSNSATQIDGTNWAVVKSSSANDYVYVQAMLDTTNTAALAMAGTTIQWTGGEAVPGNPLQRRVSKTNSVETTITASLGSTATNLNVWVIWANLTIKVSGTLDPDDKAAVLDNGNWPTPTSTSYDSGLGGGNSLGAIDCLSNSNLTYAFTIGKMEAKAILQPAGIQNFVTNGAWNMKRTRVVIAWDNGGSPAVLNPLPGEYDANNEDAKYLNPVKGDMFGLDAPGCAIDLSGTTIDHTAEVYDNFFQYVTVNFGNGDQICSNTNTWSYTAQVDIDATNKVQLNSLSTSLITLPTTPHFQQR